ncbi:MAG: bifunctional diguanylate cyclase/phosphodiesterase [Gammaproteobacteria bacterium]|nr:bifunctional diguanylate cyclase/phosphodiesterase [Gammaproteobacteria bacterium]
MFDLAAIAAFVLLALGAAMLGAALMPVRDIVREARGHSRVWLALPALIVAFVTGILGYLMLAIAVARRETGLMELAAAAVLFGAGCFVWAISRISRRMMREMLRLAALEQHRATHDPLTNLPNRQFFEGQLERAIADNVAPRRLAVLVMDLDRFKLINKTMGHHYGDTVLQEAGLRLQRSLRITDLVARLGGDDFAVLINPIVDPEHPRIIGQHVAAVLQKPLAVEGRPADVGVSIGVAYHPEHGASHGELIRHAELSMYEAKRRGADVVVYEQTLDSAGRQRLVVLGELRQAIEQQSLVVHYQPQFGAKAGRLTGVEALVRWPHPRLGLLYPEEFIALAEQNGLIGSLNRWVLEVVLDQLAAWHSVGNAMPISTNISAINLQEPDLVQHIADGVRKRGLPPRRLKLEITETAVMSNPDAALAAAKRLSQFGVRFSIDDFGTGYSSLVYLRKLPVSEIKIDRSFIVNVARDHNDAIIVRSTIALAHNLGHWVTAEGIENRQTLELLAAWGCDALQGYFLSPPLPIEALNARLKDSAWNPVKSMPEVQPV